jgi:hypothetical protein
MNFPNSVCIGHVSDVDPIYADVNSLCISQTKLQHKKIQIGKYFDLSACEGRFMVTGNFT